MRQAGKREWKNIKQLKAIIANMDSVQNSAK